MGSESAVFTGTFDTVFAASQKAVRDLGYKVDAIDRANGLLNFKTGMSWKSWAGQEMSLMLIDNGDGSIEVTVSGRRNQSGVVLQIYDWGEASGIARSVLGQISRHLAAETSQPNKQSQAGNSAQNPASQASAEKYRKSLEAEKVPESAFVEPKPQPPLDCPNCNMPSVDQKTMTCFGCSRKFRSGWFGLVEIKK